MNVRLAIVLSWLIAYGAGLIFGIYHPHVWTWAVILTAAVAHGVILSSINPETL